MAKKYLDGADIENDSTKCKARLLGIAHECYVQRCEDKGTDYIQDKYVTLYGASLKQKKYDSGELEEDGSKKFTYEDYYTLEFDDEGEDYYKMIDLHKNKCKTKEEKESEGWDLT